MIATEPLSADVWAELGWDGCETMLDGRNLYTYVQRTADGRIALGGRGDPYVFGSGTAREPPPSREVVEHLRGRVRDLFGVDAEVAAAWQGVLGVSRTWRPAVGVDAATGFAWAGGYAGDGVAASNLAGTHAPRPHPRPRDRANAPAVGRRRSSDSGSRSRSATPASTPCTSSSAPPIAREATHGQAVSLRPASPEHLRPRALTHRRRRCLRGGKRPQIGTARARDPACVAA